ncbi:MAG TPA: PEP-CTERM sorting domain-containing protein [Tepidisphaeraceae bacterium]|jgi:hypothetical protein|nr:PEP-CTERM sorting domain-containing protein [Tepidisphaeraceae bacterium]
MRSLKKVALAAAGVMLVGSSAKATLTISLVPVVISSAAKTADPALNNARSFDVDVTQSGGEFWNVGDMQINLVNSGSITGSFYTPTGHSNAKPAAPATANLAYDTNFSTPQFDIQSNHTNGDAPQIDVVGSGDYPNGPGSGTAVISGTTLNVGWADHEGGLGTTNTTGGATSTYQVARLTILGNTGAYIKGYFAGTSGNTMQIFSTKNATGAFAAQIPAGATYLPLFGDGDLDGAVGGSDVTNAGNQFGSGTPGVINPALTGDVDGDGVVGGNDVTQIGNNFGNQMPSFPGPAQVALGALVPEPSSVLLIGLGASLLGSRRRK